MKDYPQDLQNIEKRIYDLKHKSEQPKHKNNFVWEYNQAVRTVIDFISPVFIGICIGYLLDKVFNILPICLIVFAIFGLAAGILNIYKIYGATSTEKRE